MSRMVFGISLMLAAGLISCGGGDPAKETPIAVNISPSTLTATYVGNGQSLNQPYAHINATLTNLPSTPIYAVITQDRRLLQYDKYAIFRSLDGTFSTDLLFLGSMEPGHYQGNFTLNLYKDKEFTSPYPVTGGTLPYDITVTPGITFTASVNNISANISTGAALNVKAGDVVQLQSSLPVGWSTAEGGAYADSVVTTSTSWKGTLRYGVSTPGSTGFMTVQGMTPNPPQFSASVSIFVRE